MYVGMIEALKQADADPNVRVVLVKDEADETKDKIGFEFVEGPVTPKQEKLPGARKRPPGKSKPGGPGGSKGPTKSPLVPAARRGPPRAGWSWLDLQAKN